MNQDEAQKLIDTIYTPEKKKIWAKEMEEEGEKFISGETSFEQYMKFRAKLRQKLGYPA